MTDATKVGAPHLQRAAYVYLRQSSPHQVEHNRESTQLQYALVTKATNLGWPPQQIVVIDEDLGLPGTGITQRNGFAQLTAEVALGHVRRGRKKGLRLKMIHPLPGLFDQTSTHEV
jgi:DNA invertase Pin-like site-specific DNA recombinase